MMVAESISFRLGHTGQSIIDVSRTMHSELWNHAVALYGQPGVEAACLVLQEHGADVCLLLCGTWLQARGVQPDAERAAALKAIAGPWQKGVIGPVRALRQQWRSQALVDPPLAALREQLKRLELDSERALLARLEEAAGEWPADLNRPVSDWLSWLVPEPARDQDALQQLRTLAERLQDAEEGD